jgi:hypothetical protein
MAAGYPNLEIRCSGRLTERRIGLRMIAPLLEFYVRLLFLPTGPIEPIFLGKFDEIQK